MRVLAIDSALGAAAAAMFEERRLLPPGLVRADAAAPGSAAAILPRAIAGLIAVTGPPELIAVTVGPGSFTGVRAGLALAHGLAAGWRCALAGVAVTEALAHDAAALAPPGHPLWIAVHSRPGRVFLGRDGAVTSEALDDLPPSPPALALAGTEADAVAARLRARGAAVTVLACGTPSLDAVAAIGRARHRGALPPCHAHPLYVDPPAARLPPASSEPASPEPTSLVAVSAAHAPALAAIHATCFTGKDRWSEAAFTTLLASAGISGLLDPRGGAVLFRAAAAEADIVTLAVQPSSRRLGVARGLLEAGFARLRSGGTSALFLEVAEDNAPARALYHRCGFEICGRRAAYYADGGAALVMRRSLC